MFKSNLFKYLSLLIMSTFIMSCTKSPDVRLTLCQDLTWLLLNSPAELQWQEHKIIMKGYEDLEMQVHFVSNNTEQGGGNQASCFYSYNESGSGATDGISDIETFQNPTAAYSTYPNKMILKGKIIDNQLLANSIVEVMKLQGQESINKITEAIKETIKKVDARE